MRPKRGAEGQIEENTRGQRSAGAGGAPWPRKRRTVGIQYPVRMNRVIDDRIEHWLRCTHPRTDSHFPLCEDLPMEIVANAMG